MADTQLLNTAVEAARIAGGILQDWVGKFTVREKRRADLVTEADFAAQQAIHEHIHARYPDHNFLGEEGLNETNSDSPYRWIIDPLDGTSNYVHRFPYYGVSIGLECQGEMQLGVIFDPNRDELFSANQGDGARLNGVEIQPSDVDSLSDAMLVASLPIGATPDHPAVAKFLKVLPRAQTVQRTGSAALNLAYVAAGRIDAFFSSSLKPWDVAAGKVIVEQAGGCVTKAGGADLELNVSDLVASNGTTLHAELCELLE